MIAIIDYGMGNLASVYKAIKSLNLEVIITDDPKEIEAAKIIVLPGVGSFKQGMENLKNKNLISVLNKEILVKKKYFLGICLGMQLIMEFGNEPEITKGLGWIKGDVIKINNNKFPIPHLGWNRTFSSINETGIDDLTNNFYFIHSYHVRPNEDVVQTYVDYEFKMVASIKKGNIFATQFHPEKSQEAGLKLLHNFFNRCLK